jgi:hypothetical protein
MSKGTARDPNAAVKSYIAAAKAGNFSRWPTSQNCCLAVPIRKTLIDYEKSNSSIRPFGWASGCLQPPIFAFLGEMTWKVANPEYVQWGCRT